jgi:predicted ATPase
MDTASAHDAIIRYEDDFAAWAEQQAALVLFGEWPHLDRENVSEELAGLTRSDRQQITNRLTRFFEHAIKLHEMPEHEAAGKWKSTMREQRNRLFDILLESPSLVRRLADVVETAYLRAVEDVLEEWTLKQTGFDLAMALALLIESFTAAAQTIGDREADGARIRLAQIRLALTQLFP